MLDEMRLIEAECAADAARWLAEEAAHEELTTGEDTMPPPRYKGPPAPRLRTRAEIVQSLMLYTKLRGLKLASAVNRELQEQKRLKQKGYYR